MTCCLTKSSLRPLVALAADSINEWKLKGKKEENLSGSYFLGLWKIYQPIK